MVIPAAAWEPGTLMRHRLLTFMLGVISCFRCVWHKNLSARAYIKTDAYTPVIRVISPVMFTEL